jgi:hypothetical protein
MRTSARKSPPSSALSRKASGRIPKRSTNFDRLLVQLSLDVSVWAIEYVDTLSVDDCSVRIEMLVAERSDGRFAFDIVDERPHRDLDAEGMLLIALHQNRIALIEVDSASINAEPKATNSLRIWECRDRAPAGTKALVERTLNEHGSLSIQDLGALTGLRDPMAAVCGLICEGAVQIDLTQKLDKDTLVAVTAGGVPVNTPQVKQGSL